MPARETPAPMPRDATRATARDLPAPTAWDRAAPVCPPWPPRPEGSAPPRGAPTLVPGPPPAVRPSLHAPSRPRSERNRPPSGPTTDDRARRAPPARPRAGAVAARGGGPMLSTADRPAAPGSRPDRRPAPGRPWVPSGATARRRPGPRAGASPRRPPGSRRPARGPGVTRSGCAVAGARRRPRASRSARRGRRWAGRIAAAG